jgi:integrase
MVTRKRYQFGSLTRKQRARGDVWEYRYYELDARGSRVRRSLTIGTVAAFPKRSDALARVQTMQLRINSSLGHYRPVTVGALVERYLAEELPERHSTRVSYRSNLSRWILPRWGEHRLEQVKPMDVEQWMRSLELAPKTKTHIRSIMHLLYENARRWELIDRNPIELVRQSARRTRIPRVLTTDQVERLLRELDEPIRTMASVAAFLGLRVSEIVGLQWRDIDWQEGVLFVQRSVVQGHVGETKTEYSARPIPLPMQLALALARHRTTSPYSLDGDWIFAGGSGAPRCPDAVLKRHIRPAAERAGIGRIGWHTFRHTYSTMLRAIGTDVKVQQELLRHADIQTTMNVYTQAVSEAKREAVNKVVQMILPGSAQEKRPQIGRCMIGSLTGVGPNPVLRVTD